MKNKLFKFLSLEEKQKTLTFVLRDKTKNKLTPEEETRLLMALSSKDQFRIRVFTQTDAYCEATSFATKSVAGKVIFGADEFNEMKASGKIPEKAIAVISEASTYPESRNEVFIFIPHYRKCEKECVSEKIICENLTPKGRDSYRCDLHRFPEVSNR